MSKFNIIIFLDKSLFQKYSIKICDILKDNPLKQNQMAVKFLRINDKVHTYVKFLSLNCIPINMLLDWITNSAYSPLLQQYYIYSDDKSHYN